MAFAVRVISKRWLAPSAFALGVWSVFTICPLVFTPSFKVSALSVWVIFALVGAFSFGALLGEGPQMSLGTLRVNWRKIIVRGLIIFAVCAGFFLLIDSVRAHEEGSDLSVSTTLVRTESYVFGYLSAFSSWVDHTDLLHYPPHLAFGGYTFAGIFEVLGLKQREVGIYREFVQLGDPSNPGMSNIFTAFRGMTEDFSFPGAMVFLVLLGFLIGHAYRKARTGNIFWVPLLAGCYAFWLWSPIVSVFTYNGPILAVAVASFVVRKMRVVPDIKPETI